MQTLLENGERGSQIDAYDLIDLLLAVADEIDPSAPVKGRGGLTETRNRTPTAAGNGGFCRW